MRSFGLSFGALTLFVALTAACASQSRPAATASATDSASTTGPGYGTLGTRGRGLTPGTTHGTGSIVGAGVNIISHDNGAMPPTVARGGGGVGGAGAGTGVVGSGAGAGAR